jgi:hypothetical protein
VVAAPTQFAVHAAAWLAAALVALSLFRAEGGHLRLWLALGMGAVTAHLGWVALHLPAVLEHPGALLHPGAVSVLFVPLGVLLLAPWREALATLPMAFFVARLGCLPFDCCYETPWAAAPELGGLAALHVLVRRHPGEATPIVLSGWGLLRLLSEPLRKPAEGLFVDVELVAVLWVVAGIWLRSRIGSVAAAREWRPARVRAC